MSLRYNDKQERDRKILDDFNIWAMIYPVKTVYWTTEKIDSNLSEDFMTRVFPHWDKLIRNYNTEHADNPIKVTWTNLTIDMSLNDHSFSWESDGVTLNQDVKQKIYCWKRVE